MLLKKACGYTAFLLIYSSGLLIAQNTPVVKKFTVIIAIAWLFGSAKIVSMVIKKLGWETKK
ncbi:hypothetical protein ICJ04_17420 [Stenotrophomonas sp. 169]|uniref:hypothetical protein n=1 Tax=Stenotrophomonas sp. 169 TaxID=2770322 RepID=UPI0016628A2E|nr:hypothetical protein [Stenotrophomonas sp. 169]QNR97226.1 hypothetical protein ICJ04_17420 [Stenotrophomonas sp. 169]